VSAAADGAPTQALLRTARRQISQAPSVISTREHSATALIVEKYALSIRHKTVMLRTNAGTSCSCMSAITLSESLGAVDLGRLVRSDLWRS